MNEYFYKGTIDSHIHLDCLASKGCNLETFLHKALVEKNISAMIDIATSDKNFSKRLKLANKYTNLFLSAGIDSSNIDKGCLLENIEVQLKEKKVIAVGEIGIDLYWRQDNLKQQVKLFLKQIELANSYNKPILVHNREADNQILASFKTTKPTSSGIIHCFSSDWNFAKKALDMGMYLSFSGNITYKKSDAIREAAKKCPLERILIETDAPYLAPQPFRGKVNNSLMMGHQIDSIAQLKNISIEKVLESQKNNFETLFKLNIST